jgi:hypothetical protein
MTEECKEEYPNVSANTHNVAHTSFWKHLALVKSQRIGNNEMSMFDISEIIAQQLVDPSYLKALYKGMKH